MLFVTVLAQSSGRGVWTPRGASRGKRRIGARIERFRPNRNRTQLSVPCNEEAQAQLRRGVTLALAHAHLADVGKAPLGRAPAMGLFLGLLRFWSGTGLAVCEVDYRAVGGESDSREPGLRHELAENPIRAYRKWRNWPLRDGHGPGGPWFLWGACAMVGTEVTLIADPKRENRGSNGLGSRVGALRDWADARSTRFKSALAGRPDRRARMPLDRNGMLEPRSGESGLCTHSTSNRLWAFLCSLDGSRPGRKP